MQLLHHNHSPSTPDDDDAQLDDDLVPLMPPVNEAFSAIVDDAHALHVHGVDVRSHAVMPRGVARAREASQLARLVQWVEARLAQVREDNHDLRGEAVQLLDDKADLIESVNQLKETIQRRRKRGRKPRRKRRRKRRLPPRRRPRPAKKSRINVVFKEISIESKHLTPRLALWYVLVVANVAYVTPASLDDIDTVIDDLNNAFPHITVQARPGNAPAPQAGNFVAEVIDAGNKKPLILTLRGGRVHIRSRIYDSGSYVSTRGPEPTEPINTVYVLTA